MKKFGYKPSKISSLIIFFPSLLCTLLGIIIFFIIIFADRELTEKLFILLFILIWFSGSLATTIFTGINAFGNKNIFTSEIYFIDESDIKKKNDN